MQRDWKMAQRLEHAPGEAAPATGTYEQRNIFGTLIGIRVSIAHGQSMPSAPLGHTWTRAGDETDQFGLFSPFAITPSPRSHAVW
jgi:hypothetical protein